MLVLAMQLLYVYIHTYINLVAIVAGIESLLDQYQFQDMGIHYMGASG